MLTRKGKRKARKEIFHMRATPEFLADVQKCASVAGEESVSAFVRRLIIEWGKRNGVDVRQ